MIRPFRAPIVGAIRSPLALDGDKRPTANARCRSARTAEGWRSATPSAWERARPAPKRPIRSATQAWGSGCRFCSAATERTLHVRTRGQVPDVDPDHLAGRLGDVEAREGPPADIPAKSVQILHDPDQRTAVVIQLFETADDMAAAEGALDAMDPADTPGTRASIDRCEIQAKLSPA